MSQALDDHRAELLAQNFEIKETSKGWKIIPPDKTKDIVIVHKTESDRRAYNNTLARLRRAGFIKRRK